MGRNEVRARRTVKRVAIYTRVSTRSKGEYSGKIAYDQRPEVQDEPLRRLAAERGWTIARIYSDRISGTKQSRSGLQAMLEGARRHEFDVLMVLRFDRLSRRVLHFLQLVEELQTLGIDFISHEQALDTTTPMGRFTLTMFAALAELERQVIRERVLAGLQYARQNGTKSGKPIGRPLAVFRRDQVPALREEGFSWGEIAHQLGAGEGTVRRVFRAWLNAQRPCQNPIRDDTEAEQQTQGLEKATTPAKT